MNYRIQLCETFDDNGVSIINLFVEIKDKIYNSTHKFVDEKERELTISKCFAEISYFLKESKMRVHSKIKIDDLRLLLQWAEDLDEGEMVQTTNYTMEYLKFDRKYSTECLTFVCSEVNKLLKLSNLNVFVYTTSGRIQAIQGE